MNTSAITIAGFQTESRPGDVDANLARLSGAATRAVAAGASILVTPEMFVTGYNIGVDLVRDLAQQDLVGAVGQIARETGIAIIAGLPSMGSNGTYNCAACVGADGQLF